MSYVSQNVTDVWYFAPLTDTDRSGELWILLISNLVAVTIVTALRFILRRRALGLDDALVLGAVLSAFAHYIILFFSIRRGLGQDSSVLSDASKQAITKTFLASNILGLTAHYLAKLSIAILIGGIILCGVVSIILAGNARFPLSLLEGPAKGSTIISEWATILALDVATEILLSAIPTWLMMAIMRSGSQRTLIAVVFLSRLPLCAFSVVHWARVRLAVDDGNELFFRLLGCVGALEILLLWSLITSSTPALKTLMQPFNQIREEVERKDNGLEAHGRGLHNGGT